MQDLVQFKFAMVDLELIVSQAKEVMESCIERIRTCDKETYDELVNATEEEIGNFSGYWKTLYNMVKEKFGDVKAKEFQKEMIIHHYKITENWGDESALRYSIGFDISWDNYKKIIKNYRKEKNP